MKHTNKTERIYLRVSSEEKEQIKANASKYGYGNVGLYP